MNQFAARMWAALLVGGVCAAASGQIAVRGAKVHTMSGAALENGVVVIRDGKIAAVGPAATTPIPDGFRVLEAAVVTPGLIDGRATVGLTGIANQDQDQDQLDHSGPIQPELRALDAFNIHDELIGYLRGFGITTVHTGHAPGELISGQTMAVKLVGNNVDAAVVRAEVALACTLGEGARKEGGKSPGSRGKMMAMLRAEFLKAQDYLRKQDATDAEKKPERDLRLEALARVLRGELPLMVHAQRAQDIANALRLAEEFKFKLWLDGASEGYLIAELIRAAGVPVIVHPTMTRAWGETENLTFENAAKLKAAGIPVVLQSGFEDYVPKSRVVLFEAAIAASQGGLGFDAALAAITIDAAKLLGIADRVGSIEVGKDADLALYDGDPFEYTSHCTAVLIDGVLVSETPQ